jgi:hypothetical protein
MQAARPIAPHQRDGFLQAVAAELVRLDDCIGPGTVHRVCAAVQRRYFDAPDLDGAA